MTPLFDAHLNHVAWITRNRLFDRQLKWIGQINARSIFSASKLQWIGESSFNGVHDREGKLVLWNGKEPPRKLLATRTPIHPSPMSEAHDFNLPDYPLKPDKGLLEGFSGWSELSFDEWLRGDIPQLNPQAIWSGPEH